MWLQAHLVVDCAAGVGAQALAAIQQPLAAAGLQLELRSTGASDGAQLNDSCGADYVQKARRAPAGLSPADLAGRHARESRPAAVSRAQAC